MIKNSSAIFATNDVPATVKYYEEVLGFQSSWLWGDPPTFGAASCGNVTIMFCLQPELAANMEGHQHWLEVENADEFYAGHLERGAQIVAPIENKPWGRREYTVRDPNGYHLRFAGDLVQTAPKSRPFPEGVQIVRRMPTSEEYSRVAGSAFNRDGVPAGMLDLTWQGVVAIAPDGEVIGTVRIMYDAPGWFSIWDVAVMPEWQEQGIGTKMMDEALAIVRESSPGAFVFLFTYRHGFYERLAFAKETVQMRKV